MKITTQAHDLKLHNKDTGEEIEVTTICYSYNEKTGEFHGDINERPEATSDYKPMFTLFRPSLFALRFFEGYVTALEDAITVKNKPNRMEIAQLMTATLLGWDEGIVVTHC